MNARALAAPAVVVAAAGRSAAARSPICSPVPPLDPRASSGRSPPPRIPGIAGRDSRGPQLSSGVGAHEEDSTL